MNSSSPTEPQGSVPPSPSPFNAASLWQRFKSSRVSFLTLPLLIMATITEFVILATGWKYQQTVCLPQGMGVTFFGIGPIGATILAVELLKLPLAIWTASRTGWTKAFMLCIGLPLICVLTFQLVKDMAVYEMGTAMAPAGQLLEQAAAEETKIVQLNGDLAAIEAKKVEREKKLAEFAAKKEKAKADMDEALKRNDETRQDAISLTDYQKKELSEVEIRQSSMSRAFDNDAQQLTRAIADLRARREGELARAGKWNAEEARIENAYKKKLSEYTNKKNAYEKDKAAYESAGLLKRQLMAEPVDPGVPPEREVNTLLKPTVIDDLDEQIKAKEAELIAVNNKRRDSVALVAEDARRMREDFDKRSTTKREEADRQRETILAAQAATLAQLAAEEKQLDADLAVAVQKVDGIRDEIDAAQKKAESLYEAREASIRGTQVHRIATTVEIVRGMLFGERPMSINATAKERGDVLTDQISMVRIWVYPVLAFIVAFLPTLMVEIGFSTLFKPEQLRPQHRLGFMGRRMHELYTRAGRQKILHAERLAKDASAEIALREKALTTTKASLEKALATAKADAEKELTAAKASAEQALAAKEVELEAALNEMDTVVSAHDAELKQREADWTAKFTGMADSLHRAISENEALRDFQKSEIDRQIQSRQNAWSDRIAQLRKELDDQRAAAETERATLLEEHHKRLMEVTEDSKKQIFQARRQMADAELAAVEKVTRLSNELKEARHARDTAEFQLKHQADSLAAQLAQVEADKAREIEKTARQEKVRFERQQADFEKTLRQREDDFDNRWKQREQELTLAFEARMVQEKAKVEQEARLREAELGLSQEARTRELEAHWNREVKQREEASLARLKQREQQLIAQADARLRDVQTKADEQLRRKELEFERQHDAQAREAGTRLQEELQQQEISFHNKLKQREQELANKAANREMELQNQFATDLRTRQTEWEQQVDSRIRAVETRFAQETQAKEENFQQRLRQREQQLQAQFNEREAELQARWDQDVRRREGLAAESKQREQELLANMAAEHEAHEAARMDLEMELEVARSTIEPLRALLAQAEKACNDERQSAAEGIRHVQDLRKKLMEASSALNSGKNGRSLTTSRS